MLDDVFAGLAMGRGRRRLCAGRGAQGTGAGATWSVPASSYSSATSWSMKRRTESMNPSVERKNE